MKLFKYLVIVISAVAFFAACQKELDFDANGTSVGTIKSSGGDCLPSTVYGVYRKDSVLNNTNYIDIQVNVTQPGTYIISTDTVSGFSFRGTGTLGNPGLNLVRLYGAGKPTDGGDITFTVQYGTSTCEVTVTVEQPGGGGGNIAIYTLGGAPGSCSGAVLSGAYVAGTALTTNNTITIQVNVTTPGTFLIGSLPANGMTFGAAGTFTTTGVQTVVLNGVGIPLAAGISNHSISTGSGSPCIISITTQAAGPQAAYTLGGAPGTCTSAAVNGTYTAGTLLTTANTAVISVNVSTVGAYLISTTNTNGFIFSAAGIFTNTGNQNVTLTALGTPTAPGNFSYTVTGGGSSCSFPVTVTGTATNAAFTLGGAPGNCASATPNGLYTAGTALTSANTVTINVNVTAIGAYAITTTTVNGISFAASGVFSATGPQTVNLVGTGTPAAAGSFNYPATGGGSTCTFPLVVNGSGSLAAYTLSGAPGTCSGATTAGTFATGTALNAGNTVTLTVNVTTIGAYSITTNSNNGIGFSKSGTFTTTGSQTVVLTGTGTPTAVGTFNFTATGGGTTCTFSVVCTAGAPANTDYFPLTQNSWWSYDYLGNGIPAPDTLYKKSDVQSSVSGNTYRNFRYGLGTTLTELTRYRKSGSDYYQYILADTFSFYGFDVPQFGEILFLKENAPANTTWQSPEFTGQSSGFPLKLKYVFTIENANTTLTVNGVNYTNVIKVFWKSQIDDGSGYADDQLNESWYAKGIGLIKYRYWDATGSPSDDVVDNIRFYQVF